MVVVAALSVLFNLGQTPAQTPNPKSFTFAGQQIALTYPTPGTDSVPSNDVATWTGWSGLAGAKPVFDDLFASPRDWSAIETGYSATPEKPPVVWRTKIFVLANLDSMDVFPDGTFLARRNAFAGPNFSESLNGIAQLVASVYALSHGKVRLDPDVVFDPEPTRDVCTAESPSLSEAFLKGYLASRINGGAYEADDKIYRGPYQSVLVITPEARASSVVLNPAARFRPKPFWVNGMPVAEAPYYSVAGGATPGCYPVALVDTWTELAQARFKEKALPAIQGSLDRDDWADAASLNSVPTDTLLSRLAANPSDEFKPLTLPGGLSQLAYKSANVNLSIESDPEKGQVLSYAESEWARFGGFALPHGDAAIDLSKTPSLTLSVKASVAEPVAFTFTDAEGKSAYVSLGRDRRVADPSIPVALSLPFAADGAWHSITIDLKSLGLKSIAGIRLGASPADSSIKAAKLPVAYQFAEFKLGSDAPTPALKSPTPDPNSADPADRMAAAVELGKKGAPDPALTALLKDPEESVILNAAAAYRTVKDPFVETRLGDLSLHANPRIAEMALRALANQGTETANGFILRALQVGLDNSREVAADIVSQSKDPKAAGEVSVLISSRDWRTRLAGAVAMGNIPGPNSEIFRMAFLDQEEPAIRFAVVQEADPKEDTVRRRLEWSAVNDPSDLVRAGCNCKLIQSADASVRAEGYKGVRDDSIWARIIFLDYMRLHPNDQHLSALKLAITDRNELVKTNAVLALAAQTGASLADLQGVLDDRNPEVQLAIFDSAKQRGWNLPASVLDGMRKSPDKRVSGIVSKAN